MIPIYLKMEGFLTFKKPTEIHFDEFIDDGLFLVSGPTGSGKTSIFDAISFALYGVATTSQRSPNDLRSHLIGPDDDFNVEFRFRAGTHEYCVRRWQKGQRGAKQILVVDDREDEALTKITDIRQKLFDVLGLTADQFCKIVMLPQGEFRNFLAASSKDKSDILRKLFDTDHYALIREKIRQKLAAIRREVDRAHHLIETEKRISPRASQAADPDEIRQILQEDWKEAKAACETFRSSLDLYRSQLDVLSLRLEEGTRINKQLIQADELQQKIEIARNQEQSYQADLEMARQINRIRPLTVLQKSLVSNRLTLTRRHQDEEDLARNLETAEAALITAQSDYAQNPQRQSRLKELTLELERIQEQLTRLIQCQQVKTVYNQAASQLMALTAQLQSLQQWAGARQTLTEEREKLAGEEVRYLTEVSRGKEDYQTLRRQLEHRITWQKLKQSLADFSAETQICQEKIVPSTREGQENRRRLEQLREEFERQGLGQFVHHLKDDQPCPLCGSKDHPTPFRVHSAVTQSQIRAQEQLVRQLERDLDQTESRLALLLKQTQEKSAELAELEETMDPSSREGSVAEGKAQLELLVSQIRTSQSKLEQTQDRLRQNQRDRERADQEIQALGDVQTRFDAQKEQATSLKARLDDLSHQMAGLDEALLQSRAAGLKREDASLSQAIQHAEQTRHTSAEAVARLKASAESMKEEILRLDGEAGQLETQLNEGLEKLDLSREEFLALEAKLDQEDILRQGAEGFFRKLANDQSNLELMRRQLEGKVRSDLTDLQNQINDLKARETALGHENNAAIRRESALDNALIKLESALSDYKHYREKLDMAVRLDTTTGKGTTFENYVLGYYLDGVLINANERLKKMTSGRFTLLRQSQDSGGKSRIEGLDLNVFDAYSNSQRDVKTLSGGEGFKASLALALGLSDFIQEKNAGIRLDTIFIDEGFGTLDHESLDSAMETILELQGLGRLVGIISHVEELKERIPIQIVVENRREEGSVIKVVKL